MPKVLITRPQGQAEALAAQLRALNITPVTYPLLQIQPFLPDDDLLSATQRQQIVDTVSRLEQYQRVIFISTNAANIAAQWFQRFWPRQPEQQWLAIGAATANSLNLLGLLGQPNVVANSLAMNSESLLALPELQADHINASKLLIVRGQGGRETLKTTLMQRGAEVDYLELYARQPVTQQAGSLAQILDTGLDILTINSGETLDMLLQQAMMDNVLAQILTMPLIVPSPRLLDRAAQLGFTAATQAENAGNQAMIAAITTINNENQQ